MSYPRFELNILNQKKDFLNKFCLWHFYRNTLKQFSSIPRNSTGSNAANYFPWIQKYPNFLHQKSKISVSWKTLRKNKSGWQQKPNFRKTLKNTLRGKSHTINYDKIYFICVMTLLKLSENKKDCSI